MPLVAFLGVAVLTVPLFRGHLSALADVRFRAAWALVSALLLQATFLLREVGAGLPTLFGSLHIASYVLAGVFLWANRGLPGARLIALGGAMNLLVMAANGGVMPASPDALASAGLVEAPGWFTNSAALPDPRLLLLGDVFAIPQPMPFSNVFSPGDVLMALGGAFAIHGSCGSRLLPARSARRVIRREGRPTST